MIKIIRRFKKLSKKYIKLFKILKQYNKIAYKLRLLVIIRKYNIIYILLLENNRGKYERDTNVLEYKFKTNYKDRVKSIVYYKI